MHRDRKGPGDHCSRIVVPQNRRYKFFHLAHSALIGGHFSRRRRKLTINRIFTWPTLGRDVQRWCETCPECQIAQKARSTSCFHVGHYQPFKTVALDIIGPCGDQAPQK